MIPCPSFPKPTAHRETLAVGGAACDGLMRKYMMQVGFRRKQPKLANKIVINLKESQEFIMFPPRAPILWDIEGLIG